LPLADGASNHQLNESRRAPSSGNAAAINKADQTESLIALPRLPIFLAGTSLTASECTLGNRHLKYGVTSRDYETFGKALMATLEAELGLRLTRETRDAWVAVYNLISSLMQEQIESAPCLGYLP